MEARVAWESRAASVHPTDMVELVVVTLMVSVMVAVPYTPLLVLPLPAPPNNPSLDEP